MNRKYLSGYLKGSVRLGDDRRHTPNKVRDFGQDSEAETVSNSFEQGTLPEVSIKVTK
jgi:hypothetical protein